MWNLQVWVVVLGLLLVIGPAGAQEADVLEMSKAADRLYQQGAYREAVRIYEQAVEVARQKWGEEDRKTLVLMNGLAQSLNAQGDLASARELCEQVLGVSRRVLGEEHPDTLTSMDNLAGTLFAQGDLASARELCEQVLEIRRRVLGEEHPHTLTSMNHLASSLNAQGDLASARELFEQVLGVSRRVLGEEHLDTLASMDNLAQSLLAQGELASARELFEQVLEIRRRVLGEEHPHTLASMNNLASSLDAQGDLTSARELQEQVVEVSRRVLGEEHPDTLASMDNLALNLTAQGDLASARELQEQVLEVRRRALGEEHPDTLTSMNNLANTLYAQGDLASARELYERVVEVWRRVLGEEHFDTLTSMNNLANTLYAQGDLAPARELHEQVAEVSRRVLGEEHPNTLMSMNNLVVTLLAEGDLASARELEEQVLEVRRRVLGEEHPDTLTSMNNLANILHAQGDLASARELYERVVEVWRRVLGEEHPNTLTPMHNLAKTLHALGDLVGARQLYEKLIAIREDLAGPVHRPNTAEEATTFANLAAVHRDAKNLGEARLFFLRALDAIEAQTQRADVSEDVKSSFRSQQSAYFRAAVATSIALKRQGEAFNITERYRAQSLLTLLSDEDPVNLSEIPHELEAQRKEIATRYDAIYREIDRLSSVPQPDKEAIRKLIQEQNQLRRKRDVTDAKIRRAARRDDWQPSEPLPLKEIRQTLAPGTLLISYSIAGDGLDVFLLSKNGDLEVRHVDVKEIKLRLQVEIFRDQIHEKESSEARHRVAGWLYERLLQPVADRIETSDRLLILPDGPLHELPFPALVRPTGEGRWQYLVEWKPLHIAASATVYAELRKRRRTQDSSDVRTWELVAFGDPAYPGQNGEDRTANFPTAIRSAKDRGIFDGLSPLPNTNREVREISRLFPPETVLTHLRHDAREERAKAEAGKARILHFATHGFADHEIPLDSFLALTIPALDEKADDNGILQAWEILRSRLDADLVVLSACETAFGPERGGEGLMSLSRAFQIAGARSVAASLWRVADLSTSELMIRFYRHLRDGKTKDEALQAAQLELIRGPIEIVDDDGNPVEHDFSAPYHWAAFQLIGDWQ